MLCCLGRRSNTVFADNEDVGDHDVVGKAKLSLLPYMMIKEITRVKPQLIPLTITKEKEDGVKTLSTGDLMMKVEFLLGQSPQ